MYDKKCYYRHREKRQEDARNRYYKRGGQSMEENKDCSLFFGVHVAERVLSHVFKDVQRMPMNTPGYDFVCRHGYKIDVKGSCRYHSEKRADRADWWGFRIKHNPVADYFLCIAFDSRHSLNPEHIWLIPGGEVNDHEMVTIAETRLDKWSKYEQPVDKVCACCNVLRERETFI